MLKNIMINNSAFSTQKYLKIIMFCTPIKQLIPFMLIFVSIKIIAKLLYMYSLIKFK